MISFEQEHYTKFAQGTISGTGYLAYRDIPKLIDLYQMNMDHVLDLGCASGRSTQFLKAHASKITACDVSEHAVGAVAGITPHAFVSQAGSVAYPDAPYSSIFAFFTFMHLTHADEVKAELQRAYHSLSEGGYLVVVNGTEDLFHKEYESVEGVETTPSRSGDLVKIKLKKIDCEVSNCYWEAHDLAAMANESGFSIAGVHKPVGFDEDGQSYIDETRFAPYYMLILRK